jgi:hypothetical protein
VNNTTNFLEDGVMKSLAVTRRDFIGATVLVGSLTVLPQVARADPVHLPTHSSSAAQPVISFHMDQPYVDYTGTAQRYVPPAGARSAHFVSELDEAAVSGTLCL